MITMSIWLAAGIVASLACRMPEGDIEKALKLAGDKPEIVLEMAGAAATESGPDECAKNPGSRPGANYRLPPSSIRRLADLELRAGHIDKAIETLERGLKSVAKQDDLRVDARQLPGHARRHRQAAAANRGAEKARL